VETNIIRTQAEYDELMNRTRKNPQWRYFDIDKGQGISALQEVERIMDDYFSEKNDRFATEKELSRSLFTPLQSMKIIDYFNNNFPENISEYEQGFNSMNIRPDKGERGYLIYAEPKIIIKGSSGKLNIDYSVTTYDNSFVEATGNYIIGAYDESHIIVHDNVGVMAYNKARIDAYDNATIIAKDDLLVHARQKAIITALDKSYIYAFDKVHVSAYNASTVQANGDSEINAYDDAHVIARVNSKVDAMDKAHVEALDNTIIHAGDNSCIIGMNNAQVFAYSDPLIITRDNANVTTNNNVCWIDSKVNDVKHFRKNISRILGHPLFKDKTLLAAQTLVSWMSDKNKIAMTKKLLSLGCTDEESLQKIIPLWVKGKLDISRER
jgi:hypothetical protein